MSTNNTEAPTGMGMKITVIAALALAIIAVLVLKNTKQNENNTGDTSTGKPEVAVHISDKEESVKLPKLMELGSNTCTPCKLMKPILENLKKTHDGKLIVQIIDVKENPELKKKHEVKLIPTQIFFDAEGKELFRHEGFYSEESILSKWKELNIDFDASAEDAAETTTTEPKSTPSVPQATSTNC